MSEQDQAVETAGGVVPAGPYHSLRIARVIEETHDSRSLVLDVPDALRETFRYQAGQFLTFRVPVAGKRLVRCYSLSSSPDSENEWKVTVKRVAEGRVSNWMNEVPAAGDVLEVMHPAGLFLLDPARDTPLVLFAGGSGITPVISIVKTALATTTRPVTLLYANRDARSIIFEAELERLAAASGGRLLVLHRLDDRDGLVDATAIRAHVGTALAADFYVCGPGPFMDVVEQTLLGLGVGEERIFIERFETAEVDDEPAGAAVADAAGDGLAQLSVEIDGESHEVPYREGDTVLETVRKAGLEPPFSCEEGYCSCCMARIVDGSVEMKTNDCLDKEQVASGWVLTCQSIPTSKKLRIAYPD